MSRSHICCCRDMPSGWPVAYLHRPHSVKSGQRTNKQALRPTPPTPHAQRMAIPTSFGALTGLAEALTRPVRPHNEYSSSRDTRCKSSALSGQPARRRATDRCATGEPMHTACSKCDRHARAATPEHGPACAELHKQRAGAALHAPTVNPGMMKSILLPPELATAELARSSMAFRAPFPLVRARPSRQYTNGTEAWQARSGLAGAVHVGAEGVADRCLTAARDPPHAARAVGRAGIAGGFCGSARRRGP